ncbi:MAG: response regulator [Thermodesulfobacteriota bacterium]
MPDRLKKLEQEVSRLRKVNRVLMERVERSIDSNSTDFGLFEHNILLQKHVEARTAELEKLQTQLLQAQKMESVGILAGGVAHDFNNLLHVMRGNIELLTRDISNDPQGEDRLQSVTRSLDRAAKLVEQLLLFSRKADSNKILVDVNREVHEAVRMLERTIPKMISLELHFAPELGAISGDPVLIEQVLVNLTNNAVDAMPQGGRLIIETSSMEPDQGFAKRCPDAANRPHVLLSVADTGCGMDAATLEHVFDPFFTTKEVGRGTGLGLASVYGIVKGHGGDIQCYSEPGLGTTFRIYFPVANQAEETPRDVQSDTPVRGGEETILVVDDEAEIRELTQEVLEGFGYKVLAVEDGEQAIKTYEEQEHQVHLILLDLNMPGMGGYKCLQELLKLNPAVKVVIASGYSASGQARESLSSGARGFVGKPYHMKELAETVRRVLDI